MDMVYPPPKELRLWEQNTFLGRNERQHYYYVRATPYMSIREGTPPYHQQGPPTRAQFGSRGTI